ncbi:MAG: CBS domain-containing protein [Candidatus Scalinduaceae bacterium]
MRRSEFMVGGGDFNNIKANQAMENSVSYCYSTTRWKDIASALVKGGFGSLPVIDSEGNLIGIVSEYDLLRVLNTGKDENEVTAQDIMTKEAITVTEETPMMDVIKLLEDKHLIRVPVVNSKKLVGILARRDLLLCHLRTTAKAPGLF